MEPAGAGIVVCRDFGEGGTELEPCLAATKGVEVRGILCTYPMDELAERQYRSVQLVARTLPRDEYARFAANLRDLRSGLPQIEGDGTYLAFIAVGTSEQGSGLAHKLMAEAIEAAGRKPLLLTVRNNNERARAFYTRHRFHLAAEGRDFSLLRRDPTTGH
jgi:ribosomal protein S18 acetylase RimI-like enzyme